jgi:hypothetical protein
VVVLVELTFEIRDAPATATTNTTKSLQITINNKRKREEMFFGVKP